MLVEKIKQDLLESRKSKDQRKAAFLSSLYADSVRIGKDNGNRDTVDAEVVAVVKKYLKGIDETVQHLTKEARDTTNQKLEQEWLSKFLPKQLEYSTLKDVIVKFSSENNTKSIGDIIKFLKADYEGQYDGKMASEIIKQL